MQYEVYNLCKSKITDNSNLKSEGEKWKYITVEFLYHAVYVIA